MAETPRMPDGRLNLDKPRWEQTTFLGRLKHFAWVTDYRSAFVTNKRLFQAKELVQKYKLCQEPPGTSEAQVWYAKKLMISAFHPDSGELQNVIGRMSFQVPGGMILTAGMLQFYRTNTAVVFWQWLNQSFNALVNYTNRNAASSVTTKQIAVAYASATTSAVVAALGFKNVMSTRAPPLMQRFVPFLAVAAANMVNIPLSRQSELSDGVVLVDDENNQVTKSKYAAVKGISLVTISRITMAAPGMLTLPLIMEVLEKKPWFMRYSSIHLAFQTLVVGCFLTVMVPVACAMFPQKSFITLDRLKQVEPDKYNQVIEYYQQHQQPLPQRLYFNKGL